MVRRTKIQIEKDCSKIKEAAKTATSIAQITAMTGLSYSQIMTSLSNHQLILKQIKVQIENNKIQEQNEKANSQLECETHHNTYSNIVIDASITGCVNFKKLLTVFFQYDVSIILTSITVRELKNLQRFQDISGNDAKHLLELAAENPTKFKTVEISEALETPDDCIVDYCTLNKETTILLTADKEMYDNSTRLGIKTYYFKQSKICTLLPAHKIDNGLEIFSNRYSPLLISVNSNRLKAYDNIKLHVGDDVFISTRKLAYITFAHYRIINLNKENNCILVYSRRLYDYNQQSIQLLPIEYQGFIKDFLMS